jgi:hypothetical protein
VIPCAAVHIPGTACLANAAAIEIIANFQNQRSILGDMPRNKNTCNSPGKQNEIQVPRRPTEKTKRIGCKPSLQLTTELG